MRAPSRLRSLVRISLSLVVSALVLGTSVNSAARPHTECAQVVPIGAPVDTITRSYAVRLNGHDYPPGETLGAQVLVVDRCTLEVKAFRYSDNGGDLKQIYDKLFAARQDGGLNVDAKSLVILQYPVGLAASNDQLAFFNKEILARLGAPPVSHDQAEHDFSVIGSGSREGTAYVAFRNFGQSFPGKPEGDLAGYLRWNSLTGKYDFVFPDYVPFATRSDPSGPTQNTVQIGPGIPAGSGIGTRRYTDALPPGSSAGFQVVAFDSVSMTAVYHAALATNTGSRAGDLAAQQHLADVLRGLASNPGVLVMVQSIGDPGGDARTSAWADIASQIAKLGGTASVFNALKGGGYALVGRAGMTVPPAEVSQPLTGQEPRLTGDLARGHSSEFEPLAATPASTVNDALLRIAYQAPEAFPAFRARKLGLPSEANAETWIGINVLKLCEEAPCDVRQQYYTKYNTANWDALQTDLEHLLRNGCEESSAPYPFTREDCKKVADQLYREISDVSRVTSYLHTLKEPFTATSGAIAIDLQKVFDKVQGSVLADPGGKTNFDAFDVMSKMFKLGSVIPEVGGVFGGISSAIDAAAYFLRPNNSPNLLGPMLTDRVDKLAENLFDRYAQAASEFPALGKIVVSDYGKLKTMAGKVASDPAWSLEHLGLAVQKMREAARQFYYQSLLPVAYPFVIQINPAPPEGPATAQEYTCFSSFGTGAPNTSRPFHNESADGQDRQIIGFRSDGASIAPVFALSGSDPTHIPPYPVPSAELTKSLFAPIDEGGYGFTKPELYSPRYFDFHFTGQNALVNDHRCPFG